MGTRTKTITKRFGVDFHSTGGALTLPPDAVTNDASVMTGEHSKRHDSGWTITGEVHEDWYVWVNEFYAIHDQYGRIEGDFEDEVTAESEEAFANFWKHHEPETWDYWDI